MVFKAKSEAYRLRCKWWTYWFSIPLNRAVVEINYDIEMLHFSWYKCSCLRNGGKLVILWWVRNWLMVILYSVLSGNVNFAHSGFMFNWCLLWISSTFPCSRYKEKINTVMIFIFRVSAFRLTRLKILIANIYNNCKNNYWKFRFTGNYERYERRYVEMQSQEWIYFVHKATRSPQITLLM